MFATLEEWYCGGPKEMTSDSREHAVRAVLFAQQRLVELRAERDEAVLQIDRLREQMKRLYAELAEWESDEDPKARNVSLLRQRDEANRWAERQNRRVQDLQQRLADALNVDLEQLQQQLWEEEGIRVRRTVEPDQETEPGQ